MNPRDKARKIRKSQKWKNTIVKSDCYYCGCSLNAQTATMDHIVPVSRGGLSKPGNIVACCKPCNTAKGDLTGAEFVMKKIAPLREEAADTVS
ncbi:MAG: HNH endonuclease [Oligoflexales bacterium]